METSSDTLVFFVNGKKIIDENVDPEWTLLYYLRTKLRLCGTKSGCGEGGCGACTVMVTRYDRTNRKEIHMPVNACLSPICSMHGLAVTTVEGIGSIKTKIHPVQERIAKAHGSQCGFCTPGIVMSMYTLLRSRPKPSMHDLEIAFQGNLCRCTGYRPIIEGYRTFTEEWERFQSLSNGNGSNGTMTNGNGCGMGDKCCKLQNGTNEIEEEEILFKAREFVPYDPTQEPIFPPELKLTDAYDKQYLVIRGPNVTWYRPTSLEQLLDLKHRFPDCKIVVGNTEIGVEVKFKHMLYPVIVQPVVIPELNKIDIVDEGVVVGAAVTLNEVQQVLKEQIKTQPEYKSRAFSAIAEMLNWFAGKQIRSVGALGSNIMTGSPISDMIPILMANRAKLQLMNTAGTRMVRLDDKFFTGYRRNVLTADEILISILIPFTTEFQYVEAYKQARRREDDIAIVNAAINVTFEPKSDIISEISFGFGGLSFKTVAAPKTQENLKGLRWNKDTLEVAYTNLLEDLPLDPGAPGGMIQYRKSLALSLFFKAFLTISQKIQKFLPGVRLDRREISGISCFDCSDLKSSQYFTVVPSTQKKTDGLQRPLVHLSAYKQATGEAVYCDDLPEFENEVYMALVTSTKAHARVLSIDPSEALAMADVYGFYSAKDISEKQNISGSVRPDEKVFYSDFVTCQGQVIGVIAAKDQTIAQKAARKVKIEYEEIQPIIVTIEDAIEHNSYIDTQYRLFEKGDVDKAFKDAPHVLSGECRMGGQIHFYLETHSVIVVPKKEDDEMEIFCSTQHPAEIQEKVANFLGIHQNKIVCKVKRIGGGFGGKESQALILTLPAAYVAKKLGRPVRCMMDRDEDMYITGGRHPFMFKYKVAFDNDGKLLGLDINLYVNAGYSLDLSEGVLSRAITHLDNAYCLPALRANSFLCKTNIPSNTAFRGFGGPQGMYAIESIVYDISEYLGKDIVAISALNLYKEGDLTPYNQPLTNCTIDLCWKECLQTSNFYERRKSVDRFNRENKYKKRGLSILPTKYGIAFNVPHLNQGGALILVYLDGSVLLSHGGIEMGQGLYTKMIQVASRTLEIPVELIHTIETGTDKVPNTSPTAASSGSDINGMAVMNACLTIKERLKPYRESMAAEGWHAWIKKAYFDGVSLAATGYFKTPGLNYNRVENSGTLFNYFTYGVGCSEVEIDTLTGDHKVLKTDIVMDLGESLNPAIDIGQIEGAFMQGYGLFVMEEIMYSPTGITYTRGPGTYKLPGFGDIPSEFNVSLLKGVSNPRAVYSSKAVGEPPLFLAVSVFFAIKDAIKAARAENGITSNFDLISPATSARIRMACQDAITSRLTEPVPGSFTPWNVIA